MNLKRKSGVYFKMKPYRYVIIGTMSNTSNSVVLKWQHIFQNKQRPEKSKITEIANFTWKAMFHGNSCEFGMAFFDYVSVPNLIYVLFVNWKIKTSVNFLCSKQILYLARWVVKYTFSISTARGIGIVESSYY